MMGSDCKHPSTQLWTTATITILIVSHYVSQGHAQQQQCNASDSKALLEFKAGFIDFGSIFGTWTAGTDCCSWLGVNCSSSSGRVQGLDVSAAFPTQGPTPRRNISYEGVVGASLGDLSELRSLSLHSVVFDGPMPNTFDKLKKLEDVNFIYNNFSGSVSPSLGGATSLKNLLVDIYGPFGVTGLVPAPIPSSFCNLINLQTLTLRFGTTGRIPSCFCRLSQLRVLNLNRNDLVSQIPNCMGHTLHELEELDLGSNKFTGPIPPMIGGLTKLRRLALDQNKFSGNIPQQVGNLVNLVQLNCNNNSLSGRIPASFGRLTKLNDLDLSLNFLTGITPELGKLGNLRNLLLNSNKLQGNLPPELGNSGVREDGGFRLDLTNNRLSGAIPDVWTKGSLRYFLVRNNSFSGGFPLSLGAVNFVDVSNNFLWDLRQIGNIPAKPLLGELYLQNNRLSGPVPSWFTALFSAGSVEQLFLDISSNEFTGSISPVLQISSLQGLNASRNMFSSDLPTTVAIRSFASLDLSHNKISGPITATLFASLIERFTTYLDLSFNRLQGPLPPNSGDFNALYYMDLSNNQFTGTVPPSVENMTSVVYLDLSNNNFTGSVPSKRPPPC